jgi:hypothetical protein
VPSDITVAWTVPTARLAAWVADDPVVPILQAVVGVADDELHVPSARLLDTRWLAADERLQLAAGQDPDHLIRILDGDRDQEGAWSGDPLVVDLHLGHDADAT